MNGIQGRLDDDLKKIQDQFTNINNQLNTTNITASAQIIILQESLANERDALFNIQKYLNVPFALRSCQCINVTQIQKDNLKAQIDNASAEIKILEGKIGIDENGKPYDNPKCPNGNCPAIQAIRQ